MIVRNLTVLHITGLSPEIVVVANAICIFIGYDLTIIDRCPRCGCININFAIEHTVHDHGLKVRSSSGHVVVAHNASHRTTSDNIGKTIAVDDTGCAVKEAYQSAYVSTTRDGTGIVGNLAVDHRAARGLHATVIDAGATGSLCTNSASVARTRNGNIVQYEVLHRTTI